MELTKKLVCFALQTFFVNDKIQIKLSGYCQLSFARDKVRDDLWQIRLEQPRIISIAVHGIERDAYLYEKFLTESQFNCKKYLLFLILGLELLEYRFYRTA
jgi:hypothetical protein